VSSRRYTWNGFETTLSAGIASGTTVLPLTSVTGLRAPGYLVIDPDDLAKREYIEFATINALSLEGCTRNGDGSVAGAVAHDSGAVVRAVTVHQFVDDAFDDIEALETADTNHAAAPDPHPGYVLNSELSDHAAAADPHAGYLLESGFTKAAIDALNIDADTLDTHDSTYFSPTTHDHDADYAAADHVHGYSLASISNTSGSGNGSYATIVSTTFSGLTSGKSYAYHVTGIAVINVNTTNLWEHLVKIGVDGSYSTVSTLSLPNGHGQAGGSIPITVAKAGSFVASGTTASVLLQVQTTGLSSQVAGVVNGLALRIS